MSCDSFTFKILKDVVVAVFVVVVVVVAVVVVFVHFLINLCTACLLRRI